MDGGVVDGNLSRIGCDENRLAKQLQAQGCKGAKDIFIAIYHPEADQLMLYQNGD